MLMTSAPRSTAKRTAAAICSSELTRPSPKPIEIASTDAAGAAPMTPEPAPVPRPTASEATIVPWSLPSEPTGCCPSGEPMPEKSAPPTTAPSSSGTLPSMPVSMIAIVTPAPCVVLHAVRMP